MAVHLLTGNLESGTDFQLSCNHGTDHTTISAIIQSLDAMSHNHMPPSNINVMHKIWFSVNLFKLILKASPTDCVKP
jgi:hypothetical protein